MSWPLIEMTIIILFVIFMVTQVIIPLWKNMPMFPFFISSRKDLVNGLKSVSELEAEQRLADELQERTRKLLNQEKQKHERN